MISEAQKGDIIDTYQVKASLNRGGMAYVVLASSEEQDVALKITRVTGNKDQDEQNNQATRKEAHLLVSLHHDRIVKVFPVRQNVKMFKAKGSKIFYARATELPGSPWYFAMEYLAGGTLDNYVKNCGPLTVREATNIVGNIGLGLGYLHEKGIAHNDVKPENIVFRTRISKGKPYDPVLIDFGTAAGVKRFMDEAGSWYVMSPERIRVATGRDAPEFTLKIDPVKADIWSLGILLYLSLTNNLPFASSIQRKLTSQILNDVPAPLSRWNTNVPAQLDQFIVGRCLSKRPDDRPTIKEFLSFIYDFSGRGVPAESIKDGYYDSK